MKLSKTVFVYIAVGASGVISNSVLSQSTDIDAVSSAEDAFGMSVGYEDIGLYSGGNVRGFSPVKAGNVRLEGLYMDRPGSFTDRLTGKSLIRVGLMAQEYLFPAPTGIVDYTIRPAGSEFVTSTVFGYGPLGGGRIELDSQIPVSGEKFSVAVGGALYMDQYGDGSDATYTSYGIVPHFRPSDKIEIIPFWSQVDGRGHEVSPIYKNSEGLPERVRRKQHPGPSWADLRMTNSNYGVITKVRPSDMWNVDLGVFHSSSSKPINFVHLVSEESDDQLNHRISAIRNTRTSSTSGELKASHSRSSGDFLHSFYASVRGRNRHAVFGGGSSFVDLGALPRGGMLDVAEPDFSFSAQTKEDLQQWTGGLSYGLKWRSVGSLNAGIQLSDYQQTVFKSGTVSDRHETAWIYNGALAVHVSSNVTVYASYTKGLEESGIAPESTVNRDQILPVSSTEQIDFGFQWKLSETMRLVAGGFQVEKPYFATDSDNFFARQGVVSHEGLEVSISGSPSKNISMLLGAVFMNPKVEGSALAIDGGALRPVGQPKQRITMNVNYSVESVQGLTLTSTLTYNSKRAANTGNTVFVPSQAILDAGVRYKHTIQDVPVMWRLQVTNLTNKFYWDVLSSNSYKVNTPRSLKLFMSLDF